MNSSENKVITVTPDTNSQKAGRRYFYRHAFFASAAVISVIVLISILVPSSNPQKIFSAYYEPFNAFSTITRGNQSLYDTYDKGIELYKSGRFAEALEVLDKASEKSHSSLFLISLCNMETGSYEDAIKNLELIAGQKRQYSREARWYLGLAYLYIGNTDKAREQFEILSASEGFYTERAEKILRRLK
ncbi:MAG TPA: tetratricopeptide repeat protein [Bacteroidales bacterium]|jgi:tetratricopeptide (TPR) repeat protein|nr:tetratricopeptide repeat protein [Bacteroidales bacterium]